MSTWKKILTEDDGNLGSADQTVPIGTSRTVNMQSGDGSASHTVNFTVEHVNDEDNDTYGHTPLQIATVWVGPATTIGTATTFEADTIHFKGNPVNSSTGGILKLYDPGASNYVQIQTGAMTADYTLQFPTSGPGANQVRKYAANGTSTFVDIPVDTDEHLANTNLTQTASTARTYTLQDSSSTLEFTTGSASIKLDATTSPDDIALTAASGVSLYDTIGTQGGKIRFREGTDNGSEFITLAAPDSIGTGNSATYTLPSAAPAASGYLLSSLTNGVMSWVAPDGNDNDHIGNSDLTASDATRVFKLNSSASAVFKIQDNGGANIATFDAPAGTSRSSFSGDVRILQEDGSNIASFSNASGVSQTTFDGTVLIQRDDGGSSAGRLSIRSGTTNDSGYLLSFKANDSMTQNVSLTFPAALPTANGQVLASTTSGELSWTTAGGGGGTPGGSDTQIQYNDSGSFAGDSGLVYDDASQTFKANHIGVMNPDTATPQNGQFGYGARIYHKGTFTSTGLSAGRIMYANTSGVWAQAANTSNSTATGMLAVVTDAASADEMLLEGMVYVPNNAISSASPGTPLYLGTQANFEDNVPTSGAIRLIGYVIDATAASGIALVYFKPDNSWISA